jgi:hypothetical protein
VAVVVAGGATLAVVLSTRPDEPPGPTTDPATTVVAAASGTTTPPPAAPVFAPDSPEVRYVDRLCASGDLLVSLGETNLSPPATGDPVQARRDYLTAVDRVIGIVDTALADFTALRDDAPDDPTRVAFGQIVEEFTSARKSFGEGRDAVRASDPLTVEAYGTGVEKFTDGTRNMTLAASILQSTTLPPRFTGAYTAAPHCAE